MDLCVLKIVISDCVQIIQHRTCFNGIYGVKWTKIYSKGNVKMHAIIAHSGKQYHLKPGLKFNLEKITDEVGKELKLGNVLMCQDDKLHVGTPYVEGKAVLVRVIEHGRGEKLNIIKFKRRKHHMKRQGHRQAYTRLEVLAIGDEKTLKAPKVEKKEKSKSSSASKAKTAAAKPVAKAKTSAAKPAEAKKQPVKKAQAEKKPAAKKTEKSSTGK